jgi:hypothetical protein
MTKHCDNCGKEISGVPWKSRWDWIDMETCSEDCADKAFERAVYPNGRDA